MRRRNPDRIIPMLQPRAPIGELLALAALPTGCLALVLYLLARGPW